MKFIETPTNWIHGWAGSFSALIFLPVAAMVFFAALRLVKYSELIIVKTKFGGAFIGGVLIAAVTSIPELITEIAQGLGGTPAGGISDDMGSNAFGAFLIGISALVFFKSSFLGKLGKWSRVSLFISSGLSLLLMFGLYFNSDVQIGTVGHFCIGIIPLATWMFFMLSTYLQYKFGDEDDCEEEEDTNPISAKQAAFRLFIWAVILIGISLVLNFVVGSMKIAYKIKDGSAGGIILAITTSLPEITAFFAMLKKGRAVVAVAALVGSHIFNLGITAFGDMAFIGDSSYNFRGGSSYHFNLSSDGKTMIGTFHEHFSAMKSVWPIALMTFLTMGALGTHSLLIRKFHYKTLKFILPGVVVAIYIIGWILYVTLGGGEIGLDYNAIYDGHTYLGHIKDGSDTITVDGVHHVIIGNTHYNLNRIK